MSKELTPEMKEQIEKEALEYSDNNWNEWKVPTKRHIAKYYEDGRSKSITEIQGLRTESAVRTIERDQWCNLYNKSQRELIERDQKIAAMSEQIIQLERQARIDFNRINELEDIMADNNMLDSQNPE